MTELPVDIMLGIMRESVSLFVLLVFLFFSYNLINKLFALFAKYADNFLEVFEDIADSIRKHP